MELLLDVQRMDTTDKEELQRQLLEMSFESERQIKSLLARIVYLEHMKLKYMPLSIN
jgi:hypothetical protein